MFERFIQAVHTDDPGGEEPAATRARLREMFPAGAGRRMTQLGMLVGAALDRMQPRASDSIVYASRFGESRALEGFLESFPTPSPTLFQTSIHPSGVQQSLIGRQCAVPELFPQTGSEALAGHALLAAAIAPASRVILCGGEERGTWLAPVQAASTRAFAFALALTEAGEPGSLGRIVLEPIEDEGSLALEAWFDLLHGRRPFAGSVSPGWHARLAWS
jgi:hypothetical protein